MFRDRLNALTEAAKFVGSIIEQYGLEDYSVGGSAFVGGVKHTKVDQHLQHILDVADWLMKESE